MLRVLNPNTECKYSPKIRIYSGLVLGLGTLDSPLNLTQWAQRKSFRYFAIIEIMPLTSQRRNSQNKTSSPSLHVEPSTNITPTRPRTRRRNFCTGFYVHIR